MLIIIITKDQLLLDEAVVSNCKRRKTNLSMAWMDFWKSFDIEPHSQIFGSLRLVGAGENAIDL